jgi:hypothetical protein
MPILEGFNQEEAAKNSGFAPVPAGEYLAVIESSEMVDKSADGVRKVGLKFQWQIIDGQFKGRKIFLWLNYIHPKKDVQAISQGELAQICNACNVRDAKQTEQLHNIPVVLKLGIRADQNGEPQNRILKYQKRSEAKASAPAFTPPVQSAGIVPVQPATTAVASTETKAPWER